MACVDVLLPLPMRAVYSYRLPQGAPLPEPGMRAVVPFGKNKKYTGVITAVYDSPDERKLKTVEEMPDAFPVVTPSLLKLYDWTAEYYFCGPGEVLKASLPAGLKAQSEPIIIAAEGVDLTDPRLSDRQYLLLEAAMSAGTLTMDEAAKVLQTAQPRKILADMEKNGWIKFGHRMEGAYKPKTVRAVRLLPPYDERSGLKNAFLLVKNAPKQEEVLLLIAESFFAKRRARVKDLVERVGQGANAAIAALKHKGIVEDFAEEVERLTDTPPAERRPPIVLTPAQNRALHEIQTALANEKKPVLLHGVTGSGKTYLYIELMRQTLAAGRQALYLLPEIGLTQQIIDKVKADLGACVGVYHSKFNDRERVEIWLKILKGEYRAIIGVRSAMLLPFDDLGIIICDEEHDSSFKQQEPAPRYNARDLALYYGSVNDCAVILGSATPSVETFRHARSGKYHVVSLNERAVATAMPEIKIVDMRHQVKHKLSYGLYSGELIRAMEQTLGAGEQIILFNNRRGYAPFLVCERCGHVPKCLYCDISLTFHKAENLLRCHYCGYTDGNVGRCAVCESYDLRREGTGTERMEEHLHALFPAARVARMDLDATRTKHGHQNIIRAFEKREYDILVGTQMVTKGLDFENVTLAAVVQADRLLYYPDFRAHEYAYQLLTQFAGRAGRKSKAGRVFIQTYNPDHIVFRLLGRPYVEFYENEIATRNAPRYPPFSRLIRIELRHKDSSFLESEGKVFGRRLGRRFKGQMLGPEYPHIARLKNFYRLHVLLKIDRGAAPGAVRQALKDTIREYFDAAPSKTLQIVVDIDPR
jgi:primosomal protein N' (replication factor Y)